MLDNESDCALPCKQCENVLELRWCCIYMDLTLMTLGASVVMKVKLLQWHIFLQITQTTFL